MNIMGAGDLRRNPKIITKERYAKLGSTSTVKGRQLEAITQETQKRPQRERGRKKSASVHRVLKATKKVPTWMHANDLTRKIPNTYGWRIAESNQIWHRANI